MKLKCLYLINCNAIGSRSGSESSSFLRHRMFFIVSNFLNRKTKGQIPYKKIRVQTLKSNTSTFFNGKWSTNLKSCCSYCSKFLGFHLLRYNVYCFAPSNEIWVWSIYIVHLPKNHRISLYRTQFKLYALMLCCHLIKF